MNSIDHPLIFALDSNNQLVHIDDVLNGKECKCFCPACGKKLIARQGDHNKHSFAHENQNKTCEYAYQTSLHLLAKELIAEKCEILLPPVYINKEASYIDKESYEMFNRPVKEMKMIVADSVILKKKINDFIPDILLEYKNTPLIIEICVTHPVDENKRAKIKKTGISVLEIDLRNVERDIDKDLLKEILASGEFCRWIYNIIGEEATTKYILWLEDKKKRNEQQKLEKEIKEEQRKQYLIKRNGGNLRRYKVYNIYLNSYLKNVIYNPPCKKATLYKNKRVKPINGCKLCPYFVKFDPPDAFNGFGGFATDVALYCQRKDSNNSV